MRLGSILFATFLIALVTYATPTGIEFAILHFSFSPVACILFGDLIGCVLLFFLGLRVTAVGVYLVATALEFGCLEFRILSERGVVLVADAAPTLILCAAFVYLQARLILRLSREDQAHPAPPW